MIYEYKVMLRSPVLTARPTYTFESANFNNPDLMTLDKWQDIYRSKSFQLSIVGQNIRLKDLFSNTVNLCSSLIFDIYAEENCI